MKLVKLSSRQRSPLTINVIVELVFDFWASSKGKATQRIPVDEKRIDWALVPLMTLHFVEVIKGFFIYKEVSGPDVFKSRRGEQGKR